MTFKEILKNIKKDLRKNKNFCNFSIDSDGCSFYVNSSSKNIDDIHKFDDQLDDILKKYDYEEWGGGIALKLGCLYEYHCGPNIKKFNKIIKNLKKSIIEDYKNDVYNMGNARVIEKFLEKHSNKELDGILSFSNNS